MKKSGDRDIARDRVIGEAVNSCAVTGKNIWTPPPAIFKNFVLTIRAMFREIFDESAYERFLLRTNAARSVASYRDYMCERDAAMVKKPSCC
jgi:hypothetical protein